MSGLSLFDTGAQNTSIPGFKPGQGGGLGGTTPPEPSAADKLVTAEQQRTERSRLESIQSQLRLETAAATRGYGLRSLFGALGPRSSLLGAG